VVTLSSDPQTSSLHNDTPVHCANELKQLPAGSWGLFGIQW